MSDNCLRRIHRIKVSKVLTVVSTICLGVAPLPTFSASPDRMVTRLLIVGFVVFLFSRQAFADSDFRFEKDSNGIESALVLFPAKEQPSIRLKIFVDVLSKELTPKTLKKEILLANSLFSKCGFQIGEVKLTRIPIPLWSLNDIIKRGDPQNKVLEEKALELERIGLRQSNEMSFFIFPTHTISGISGLAIEPFNMHSTDNRLMSSLNLLLINDDALGPFLTTPRKERKFSIFAHEMGHVLLKDGHAHPLDAKNFMLDGKDYPGNAVLTEQCIKMRNSELLDWISKP